VRLISSASSICVKIGTFLENETPMAGRWIFLNDVGTGDVGGHQIGRELNPAKAELHRLRERADHRGLGKTRHAFEQSMAAREHRDDELFDDIVLPTMNFAISRVIFL
jgi:hypothetical protein